MIVTNSSNCYDIPEYWDMAFSEDTALEADFIEAAVRRFCDFPLQTLYEPGCGGGRLVFELARRGYDVTGVDQSQAAVDFTNARLAADSLQGRAMVGDMRESLPGQTFDLAYCLVNTFRHLLIEDDALQHLQSVSGMLREGGLYVLGMHLLPPDADEEDEEEWRIQNSGTTIDMRLDVAGCDRKTRLETLRFKMTVTDDRAKAPVRFTSDYRMRTYEAEHMRQLLAKVPSLAVIGIYDFWYDLEEPLTLSDELGDTVFVLQKR